MKDIPDTNFYDGKLKFQGSMDGTAYTTLFTATEKIHEGWNYHTWTSSAEYPKYRFYRFFSEGGSWRSCLINEIKFTGIETI